MAEHCGIAADYALRYYGVVLEPTGHPTIPFLGPQGCTVPPHLRPICSLHVCSISWAQVSRLIDDQTTDKYFRLRREILRVMTEQGKTLRQDNGDD